jgi:hypothetical protein
MRMVRNSCAALVAVVAFAATCFAEAGTMSLSEMIKSSDLIVTGRVVNAKVGGKSIAELEVTQTLKGNPSLRRVRFFAAPIWACDVSAAEENEAGLFFLRRNFDDDPSERALPQSESDGVPLFFITHSGRGRMKFQHIDSEDFVYAYKRGEVKFPDSLRFARYPKPEDRELGLVRLADVLSYIKKKV